MCLSTVVEVSGLTPKHRIAVGDPAPAFVLPDQTGTRWSPLDNDVAGHPLLLLFGEPGPAFATALEEVAAANLELARLGCLAFVLTRSGDVGGSPFPTLMDATGDVFRAYDIGPRQPTAVLVTPNTRIACIADAAPYGIAAVLGELRRMVAVRSADTLAVHPPVLIVPMALSPADCAALIRSWHQLDEQHGGAGHSRVRPECVSFVRDYGRVQQYHIEDSGLLALLDAKLAPRIMPEIAKAFANRVTEREALVLSRYDSAEGGMLQPHRDCASAETAHRRFSMTIALNDDFVGGELKFREYGDQLYRLPVGTALVFACALMHEVVAVQSGSRFALVTHLW